MAEPLTLISIATHSLYHIIGGSAHKGVEVSLEKLLHQMKKIGEDGKLPRNHDLFRAIRISMLRATLFFVDAASIKMVEQVSHPYDKDSAITYRDNIRKWVSGQLGKIHNADIESESSNPIYTEIEYLLTSEKSKTKSDLSMLAKKHWQIEIEANIGVPLPALMTDYLQNGWVENGFHKDWFEIVSYWFSQLIKEGEMPKARDAFQNQLLAQVFSRLNIVHEDIVSSINNAFAGMPDAEYIDQKWLLLTSQVTKIENSLAEAKNEIASAHRDINAGFSDTQRMILQLTEAIKSVNNPSEEVQLKARLKEVELQSHELRKQLIHTKEVIAEQEKIRAELEKSLVDDKMALAAVEAEDYDKAELLLEQNIIDGQNKIAERCYQLAQIKELKLRYSDAYSNYMMAAQMAPLNVVYLNALGVICLKLMYYDSAIKCFEKAISLQEDKQEEEVGVLANLKSNLALGWFAIGSTEKAQDYIEKAIDFDLKTQGKESVATAHFYNTLGLTLAQKGFFKKAVEYYEKAIALYKEANTADVILVDICNNIGNALRVMGDLDNAISYLENGSKIAIGYLGDHNLEVASIYETLSRAYSENGNIEKSINLQKKATDIYLEAFPGFHKRIASSLSKLGLLYIGNESEKYGIKYLEQANNIYQKLPDSLHDYAMNMIRMSDALRVTDRDKSIAVMEEAQRVLLDTINEAEAYQKVIIYNDLGLAWSKLKYFHIAVDFLEQSLNIALNIFDEYHSELVVIYGNLSDALLGCDEKVKALNCLERAIIIAESVYDANSLDLASLYIRIGNAVEYSENEKRFEYHLKGILIRLRNRNGHFPNIDQHYNDLIEKWKNNIKNRSIENNKRIIEATRLVNADLTVDKNSELLIKLYYDLENKYYTHNNPEAALDAFNKVLEIAFLKIETVNEEIEFEMMETIYNYRKQMYDYCSAAYLNAKPEFNIVNSISNVSSDITNRFFDTDFDDFKFFLSSYPFFDPGLNEEQYKKMDWREIYKATQEKIQTSYSEKAVALWAQMEPNVNWLYEEYGNSIENVIVPFTDGELLLNAGIPLAEAVNRKVEIIMETLFYEAFCTIFVRNAWEEYLLVMVDYLNDLTEFSKIEPKAHHCFSDILTACEYDALAYIISAGILIKEADVNVQGQ